jgi:hypothetical protein
MILRVALKGYNQIYKVHGLLRIKDTMIGLNQKNEVKVWLNQNFSLNHS